MPQALAVLRPSALAQHLVRYILHVIQLEVWQMRLEQHHLRVDAAATIVAFAGGTSPQPKWGAGM